MTEDNTVHFRVVGEPNMHCSGCERTVEFVLSELAGVRSVTADHATQRITFTIDADISQTVREVIVSIGYPVDVVKEE